MTILLIGNLPEDCQESMQRFTTLLDEGLRARGHTVHVLTPTLCLARLGPRYHYGGLPKWLGYFDKFVLFPWQLRRALQRLRPDVVHFTDQASAVYGQAVRGWPVLATCHDLLQIRAALGEIPHQQPGRANRLQQRWILRCLARMPRLVCVSDQTRLEALRLTGLSTAQITVAPNALNYPYVPIAASEARATLTTLALARGIDPTLFTAQPSGFLLHVGGAHWYKNRAGLLALYTQLRKILRPTPTLVLVGPPLAPAELVEISPADDLPPFVRLSGLSHSQLAALYSLAEGLVFPSWAEGFGWPIAEAQACGCPVFASARAPLTEVGGDSTFYFDPRDPVAAAHLIAANWSQRAARRDTALAEAQRWQPARMLAAYEAVYRECGNQSAPLACAAK